MKTRISKAGNNATRQQGFTYVIIVVALLVMGIMADVIGRSASIQKKRELEKELLFRGNAYYQAIRSYYLSSPSRTYPSQIDDLLFDNRFAYKRHLRQAYVDPITGENWKLLHNASGGIVGVVSTSDVLPLKQENFDPQFEQFTDSEHYNQWEFRYDPASEKLLKSPN